MKRRIVIAGSALDPCLQRLADEARETGHVVVDATVREGQTRRFLWRLDDATVLLDDQPLEVEAAFVRETTDGVPGEATPSTFAGMLYTWALSNPQVALLNRFRSARVTSGPALLPLARACGLRVPRTAISSESSSLGGTFSAGRARPVIVQERLVDPEVRVFVVGGEVIAFRLDTPLASAGRERPPLVAPVDAPLALSEPLRCFVQALGLDYGAATLKTCPDTGVLVFLDFDPAPVFVRFDRLSGGKISRAILRALFDPARAEEPTIPPERVTAPPPPSRRVEVDAASSSAPPGF